MATLGLGEPYKFKNSAHGKIVFEVSILQDDYGQFQFKSQAEQFARTYIKFAKLWLQKHGYSPVEIRFVHGYDTEMDAFGYKQDEQYRLRQQIWADFTSPLNFGKRLSEWQGLV